MAELILPPSPSWYCSKATDSNSSGVFAYSARQDVFILDINTLPPNYLGYFHCHRDKVSCVALCQHDDCQNMCCSASDDGRLVVWDVKTFAIVNEHQSHSEKVTGLSWSPLDKNIIISGDESGSIVFWNLSASPRCCLPEKNPVFCLACSTQDSTVAAVGYKNGLILLLGFKSGCSIIHRLRGHDEEVHSLAWCHITGEEFNLSKKDEKEGSSSDNESSPLLGCLLASGCKDKTVRIWSTLKGRQLQQLHVPKSYRRERADEKSRAWITVYWSKKYPRKFLATSQGTDLVMWDLEDCKLKYQVLGGSKCHSRMLFNICGGGRDYDTICTTSMDRHIIFWKFSGMRSLCAVPTCGGFVYAVKTSPVDPGRLAIGVGDNMLRVWNLNSKSNPYDVGLLWQGIRSKVTAISWHPKKEGQLAYGTDNGRVGIYNVLSNKLPNISNTYHKRIVYCVSWGPLCGTEEGDDEVYHLYSVGDGIILKHDPHALQSEALDMNKLIQETNDIKFKFPIRSEISWNPDFTILAVGNDDGTIHIHRAPDLKFVCIVKVHQKLINAIQWHPMFTSSSPVGSDYKYWIASGSNESVVCVTDLSSVLAERLKTSGEEEITVSECMRRLEGHGNRITGLAWSPHVNGQLVSVSYDGLARVWDVNKGEIISTYNKHAGKLLCVAWNALHPDEIFTGADDFSLHKWNLSNHTDVVIDIKKKHKKKGKSKPKDEKPSESGDVGAAAHSEDSTIKSQMTQNEMTDLQKLLEDKKRELLGADYEAQTMPSCNITDEAVVSDLVSNDYQKEKTEVSEQGAAVPKRRDFTKLQFEVETESNLKSKK